MARHAKRTANEPTDWQPRSRKRIGAYNVPRWMGYIAKFEGGKSGKKSPGNDILRVLEEGFILKWLDIEKNVIYLRVLVRCLDWAVAKFS